MKSKIVRCGSRAYYVEIVARSHIAVFLDSPGRRGLGKRLGRASSLEDALSIIKADAGYKQVIIQDCL